MLVAGAALSNPAAGSHLSSSVPVPPRTATCQTEVRRRVELPAVTVITGGPVLRHSLRVGAAVLATVNLLGLGLVQPAAAHTEVSDTATTSELFGGGTSAPTRDTPVPITGFRDDTVIAGLTLPSTIKFAPNGDIFIAEKSGLIKRYTSLTDTSPDLVVNLQTEVYNYFDRGLLGLAVDRQYPTRPYIYALYSRDAPLGQNAPYWNPPNTASDGCLGPPNGPGSSTDGCVSSGRLIRITVGTNGQATATKTLVDGWCGQFTSHSIGTVLMGPDGYL